MSKVLAELLDKPDVRILLLKLGVPIKYLEQKWLEEHEIEVVDWNILRDDLKNRFMRR